MSTKKFLVMILLCVSVMSFGLFAACNNKKPDSKDPAPEEPSNVVIDDAYFCKSTGRFMVSQTVGGDLLPFSIVLEDGETLAFNGQQISELNVDKAFVESLDEDVEHEVLITKPDGKTITYKAQVAEKVIVRFANNDKYHNIDAYGPNATDTEDYLVSFNTPSVSGTKWGSSIFKFTDTVVNSVSNGVSPMRWVNQTFDGLYVLANDITYTNEGSTRRNIRLSDDYISHPQVWEVDTSFETIEGVRETVYFVPREGHGFIGTFDGRGKVIDTNQRQMSVGLLPPAYGATIKNLAMINANVFAYYSESPLVCSAKNTTFENIYIEIESLRTYHGESNRPMLTAVDNCSLKNFVVDCDLLSTDTPLVFGSTINTDENSGYGQGKETAGVFSFVDFCDVNQAGTGVINPHSYTNTPTGDAFVGTTAVNVYAVGSTPLYINQEMDLNEKGMAYKPTMRATYFVNEMYKYKSGNQMLTCDQNTFYDEEDFFDTEYEDENRTLAKIVQQAKRQRYGVDIFIKMSLKNDMYQFRYINKEGFFDAKDKFDMKQQVLKNKNAGKEQFNTLYWNVASDGTVSWKGL